MSIQDTTKKIQAELDVVTDQYGKGLICLDEKLEQQISLVDNAGIIFRNEALNRLVNPNDYDRASVILSSSRSFKRIIDKLTFAL